MARKCTCCLHREADALNLALLSGASIRDVSGRFSVSRTAAHNHSKLHLPGIVAGAISPPIANLGLTVAEKAPALHHTAKVREHVAHDLRQIEAAAEAALSRNDTNAFLSAKRTKVAYLSRAGLFNDMNAAPASGTAEICPHAAAAQRLVVLANYALSGLTSELPDNLRGPVQAEQARVEAWITNATTPELPEPAFGNEWARTLAACRVDTAVKLEVRRRTRPPQLIPPAES